MRAKKANISLGTPGNLTERPCSRNDSIRAFQGFGRYLYPQVLLLALTSLMSSRCFLVLGGFALACFSRISVAQTIVGTVTAGNGQQVLPFVNIGLPTRGLGTVADEQGHYRLAYNAKFATDTVRVSSIGFEPRLLTFAVLLAAPDIRLTPAAVALAGVSVLAPNTKLRTHELDLANPSSKVRLHMSSNQLGTELGTLVRLQRRPTLLQSLHITVVQNEAGPITFRLNLYRLDSQGQPTTEKLVGHDVLLTAMPQASVLTADLTADHLLLTKDFLLAVEWVKGSSEAAPNIQKKLVFAGGLAPKSTLFTRRTSQAAWGKMTYTSNLPLMDLKPQVSSYTTVRD